MRRAILAASATALLLCGAPASSKGAGRGVRAATLVGSGMLHAARDELDQAIADYDAALRLRPDLVPGLFDRGNAYRQRLERARSMGDGSSGPADQAKALADYARAIALRPGFAAARVNRAIIWYERGEFVKAIADCDAAIAIQPGLAEAWNNRSLAWYRSGDYARAKADFDQTIRLHQYYGNAMIMRAVPDIAADLEDK